LIGRPVAELQWRRTNGRTDLIRRGRERDIRAKGHEGGVEVPFSEPPTGALREVPDRDSAVQRPGIEQSPGEGPIHLAAEGHVAHVVR